MTEDQPRCEHSYKHLHHLVTVKPRTLVAHQPALWYRVLVILADMVLIRGEHERPVARQVDLHEAETWCVARTVAESDPLTEFERRGGKGLPVQSSQGEVRGEVDAVVGFGCNGPGGVLVLFFVDVDCGSG